MPRDSKTPSGQTYAALLASIKDKIQSAQIRAALAVNSELILLYWNIGTEISRRQTEGGRGSKIILILAKDLKKLFPKLDGVSARNLKYMKAFAEAWPNPNLVQQLVAQLPWGHNVRLLEKVSSQQERIWYAQQAIEHGWSRNILVLQIEKRLYNRQGKALTNFRKTLPPSQSDLAQSLLKDPYTFDFLTIARNAQERELETALIDQIRRFLLELGVGFAFVGSQYALEIAGEDFRIDLLFYHLKLRCFIVIDLKIGPFKPEYAGKMNFYLSAVDDKLRHPADQPTIGLILCKGKNEIIVEYSLRGMDRPLGVSEFECPHTLPEELRGQLPTIKEIEEQLNYTLNPAAPAA